MFRPSMCPPIGLICPQTRRPVPLKSVQVDVSISAFVSNVTAILNYENNEDNAIEAVFVFPMDDDSAVYQFKAEIDCRTIVAECQEKEIAKQTYDDAMSQGYTAMLLQQNEDSADIFQCSVGNLPSKKVAKVTISFVCELPLLEDGGVNFVLPTILNPRYNPKPTDGGATRPPPLHLAPHNEIPYSFSFSATIHGTSRILRVDGGKDKITINWNASQTQADISLENTFNSDHDLSLTIYYHDPYNPTASTFKGEMEKSGMLQNDIVMLSFFPELRDDDFHPQNEYVFIIDRSGSMQGSRIESAKQTLMLFLKSLPADCYFNIISFGSRHTLLFENGSTKYDEESLKLACSSTEAMQANYGGTEILQPLQNIYSKPLIDGYPRKIFVLTDGSVFNVENVLELAKENADKARVFTFGIGDGASTALVKGLARAGQGKAVFATDEERLQPKVMKILKCAMQLNVTDLALAWNPATDVQVLPNPIQPMYSGDRLILYGILKKTTDLSSHTVTLTGKVGGRKLNFEIPLINSAVSDPDLLVHRLAAKAQIKHLEAGSKGKDGEEDPNKALLVLLSTSANIVSKYCAMVGVDSEGGKVPAGGRDTRHIATPMGRQAFSGGGGFLRKQTQAPMMMMCAPPPPMMCQPEMCAMPQMAMGAALPPGAAPQRHMRRSRMMEKARAECASDGSMDCDSTYENKKVEKIKDYMDVVSLQKFDGSWLLTEELSAIIGKKHEVLANASGGKPDTMWATVLALAILELKYSDQKDEWEMVKTKAVQWLLSQSLGGSNVQSLIDDAKSIIQQ